MNIETLVGTQALLLNVEMVISNIGEQNSLSIILWAWMGIHNF
jgi:hypothetical protein